MTDERWESERDGSRLGFTKEERLEALGIRQRTDGYWWSELPEGPYNVEGSRRAYPCDEPRQFRFQLGWYRAGSGEMRSNVQPRSEEALAGWDAFQTAYPTRVRISTDPWDDPEWVDAERKRRYPGWK